MSSVRLRRLQADYEKLAEFARRHPRLRLLQAQGNPPEMYQLEYQITSLRQVDDQLLLTRTHIVEISLPRNYPRTPPQCRMLTPIFHPNIAPHAICIGDHWAAGEPLWSMAARIGEMIAYQSYNTKSPLNGEAARWVEGNLDRLPLDPVSMTLDEPGPPAARPQRSPAPPPAPTSPPPPAPTPPPAPPRPQAPRAPLAPPQAPPAKPANQSARPANQSAKPAGQSASETASPASPAAPTLHMLCPNCQTRYRFPAELAGKRARCKQCQTVFRIPML
jgi:ubiquitin-protein ligase